MDHFVLMKENWLTRKPAHWAPFATALLSVVLFGLAALYLQNGGSAADWMPASKEAVVSEGEWWRLWTTLFAHGDLGHILSNSILFIPLAYLLMAYFGGVLFPLAGLLLGGVINYLVLQGLPWQTHLIGISGVVNWMGAVWFTLFLLIDRRESLRRRFAVVLFLSLFLFVPDTYRPEVSYSAHFIGFVLGVLSAVFYYFIFREKFKKAELYEIVYDEDIDWPEDENGWPVPTSTAPSVHFIEDPRLSNS